MKKELFGTTRAGQEVHKYTLVSQGGLTAEFLTYGITLQKLLVPDDDGKLLDVVLGFDDLASYEREHPYFGSIIGRNANRIYGGKVVFNGKKFQLELNEGGNQLHGGAAHFGAKVWDARTEGEHLIMTYTSPDGEAGFPGNLQVRCKVFWNGDTLTFKHMATTDAPTIVNLTRHEYFNLAQGENVLDHQLQIDADAFLPKNEHHVPTGELRPVEGTVMDFRDTVLVGQKTKQLPDGFDHNYVLNKRREEEPAAVLFSPESGIELQLFCSSPGIQFYSAGNMPGWKGKYGAIAAHSPALCLEPQLFPDAPNHDHFPSSVLLPGEVFEQWIKYKFVNRH